LKHFKIETEEILALNSEKQSLDCYALMMITGVIETFAICHLYRLLWPWYLL